MFSRSVRHIVLSACTVAVMAAALVSAARKPEVNIGRGELALRSKSVQRLWEKNIPENIAKAQANWPGVLEK